MTRRDEVIDEIAARNSDIADLESQLEHEYAMVDALEEEKRMLDETEDADGDV